MPNKTNKKEKALDEKYAEYKEKSGSDETKLSEILGQHSIDSESAMNLFTGGWDEKEAMLICRLKDEISTKGKVHSGVFDPRLSTIVFERAARVMSQNPIGKAYAVSEDDIGKNKFMNLLLRYYQKNANTWHSMVIKSRMLDLYSLVYGTMFALVTWVVDSKRDYIGPEMIPLPIRSCFPQPGATSINDSDWFQVSSMKNINWLEAQGKKSDKWKNIDKLKLLVLGDKTYGSGDVKPDEQTSYVERTWYNTPTTGDTAFPEVELKTEYRRDRWITFVPKHNNLVIRDIENPYHNGELPIVAKHAFPLLDSMIGLGEFERGKTLQYAINSLINLYMDAVKYSIFPPIQIDPNSVIASTIKWGPGEKWLTKHPGVDIRQLRLNPGGLQTFNSTYGFFVSSLMNQAGTSDVSSNASTDSSLGKTPQAVRYVANRESARDEWDRTMMEDTLRSVYKKWIDMIVAKQEKTISVRLYGEEAKKIAKDNPDVAVFFESDGYGVARIGKDDIKAKYDYEVEAGSTMKPDLEGEKGGITEILSMVLKNPGIIDSMKTAGKDVNLGELFKRWIVASGVKDWDRIVVDYDPSLEKKRMLQQAKDQAEVQAAVKKAQEKRGVAPKEQPTGGPGVPGQQPDNTAAALQQMVAGMQGGQPTTPPQQEVPQMPPGMMQMPPNPPPSPATPEVTPEMIQQLLAQIQGAQGQPTGTPEEMTPEMAAQLAGTQPQSEFNPEAGQFGDPQLDQIFSGLTQAVGGNSGVPPLQ